MKTNSFQFCYPATLIILASTSVLHLGCSPMHSASSRNPFSSGLVYHLPKTVYKVSIKAKDAKSVQIDVTPEIHADKVSFSITPSRNAAFKRDQSFDVNEKGLLTNASAADIGRLPDILTEASKSIVSIAQVSSGGPGIRDAGGLTPDEYNHFMTLLLQSNVEFSIDAGVPTREISFPGEDGSFILHMTPPGQGVRNLGEEDIRDSLRKAGNRYRRNADHYPDETILAAGIIARPITSGKFSYSIFIKKEAINKYRQATVENIAQRHAEGLNFTDYWKEAEISHEIQNKESEVLTKIAALEADKNNLDADSERAAIAVININKDTKTAAVEIDQMMDLDRLVVRSDAMLAAYSAVLDAMRDTDPNQLTAAQKKLIVDKAVLLKIAIQESVKQAINGVNTEIVANKSTLGSLTKAKRDINKSKSSVNLATSSTLFITSTQPIAMVDSGQAQLVALKRNPFGVATNTITLTNGVITKQDIDEESEILGAVKIPLTVVEAIFDTTKTLWTKKDDAIDKQITYLNSQVELIEARAKLEAAKNPPPPASQDTQ